MSDKNEPMDDSVTEAKVGTPADNTQRVCYAAKTLVAEVEALFPETPVEYSNYDGRNTALDVQFDLTGIDAADRDTLIAMMTLFDLDDDPRINLIVSEDDSLLVSFKASARTQDSRDPFGLADAWEILTEEQGS